MLVGAVKIALITSVICKNADTKLQAPSLCLVVQQTLALVRRKLLIFSSWVNLHFVN